MGPLWESEIESGHGRIEKRTLRVIPLDEEISRFPGARQLIALTRMAPTLGGDEVSSFPFCFEF